MVSFNPVGNSSSTALEERRGGRGEGRGEGRGRDGRGERGGGREWRK